MRIGELAQRLDISTPALRYYETAGLLPEPRRTPSGYRDYDDAALERVRFIKTAQRLGLSLEDIKEILAFKERGEPPCGYVLTVIDKEADELDRKIAELQSLRQELRTLQRKARRIPRTARDKSSKVCHIIENRDLPDDRRP